MLRCLLLSTALIAQTFAGCCDASSHDSAAFQNSGMRQRNTQASVGINQQVPPAFSPMMAGPVTGNHAMMGNPMMPSYLPMGATTTTATSSAYPVSKIFALFGAFLFAADAVMKVSGALGNKSGEMPSQDQELLRYTTWSLLATSLGLAINSANKFLYY